MIYTKQRHRPAFSMLELTMVIVVLGILAALAMPRLDRDLRQEAADNILSAIRYTQHLALIDDKHDTNDPQWQRKFWAIQFTTSTATPEGNFYTISADNDKDQSVDKTETAIDPINSKYMYNTTGTTVAMDPDESPNIFIGTKYGIDTLVTKGGCSRINTIGFDHFGRPHVGFLNSSQPDSSSYMKSDCNLTFSSSTGAFNPFSIIIKTETGYTYIDGQPDS